MDSEYTINLCTFMGRKNNVRVLLQYVDQALSINAIDRYYMIDMTRNLEDHEYIYEEQQRLSGMYPGRVFIVNREIRAKELADGTWKDTIGFWAPFYKFCEQFTDSDIIIKCDDDTLYFDVETIRAAADIRWKNKTPVLMHANTINNGICAYHQAKKKIWSHLPSEIEHYPTSGLTGPLFSHPEIACECHKQFTDDLLEHPENVEKYMLKENIYFTARVSINFIFMLGSDREILSKINAQDEYIASSKIGQRLDRPNMIIGDFVASHHTYGVQEPVMEELGTGDMYSRLANKLSREQYTNKEISSNFNPTSTIKTDKEYIMKFWANENSFIIKNNKTKRYINLKWDKTERVKVIDKHTREQTGVYWHKTSLSNTDNKDESTIFTLNLEKPTLIQIQECTEVLKATGPNTTSNTYHTFPIKLWFQQNYKKQLTNFHPQPDGTYKVSSCAHPEHFLCYDTNRHWYNFTKDGKDTWVLEPYGEHKDRIVVSEIHRTGLDEVENDPTFATTPGFPSNKDFREFYWMVKDYIWEFIHKRDNVYHIKLVADDKPDLYLSKTGKDDVQTGVAEEWEVVGKQLKHVNSGVYLSVVNDEIKLSPTGTSFQFDID